MNSEQLTVKTEEESKRQIEFDFERLKVYQASLGFLDEVFNICDQLPRKLQSSLDDQFRRAALSISNNLAEGSGKRSKKEKARYFETASDSTRECLSMFNVLLRQKLLDEERYSVLRSKGREITSMIYGLLHSLCTVRCLPFVVYCLLFTFPAPATGGSWCG